MEEAKRISGDPNVKGYTDMDELKKALEKSTMYKVKFTSAYKRSYKLMKKRGLDVDLIDRKISRLPRVPYKAGLASYLLDRG